MQVWHIQRKKTDFKEIASQFNIDQVTARLLWNRDIPLDKIEKFLYGDMSHFHDESLLKDMALAKRILFDATPTDFGGNLRRDHGGIAEKPSHVGEPYYR